MRKRDFWGFPETLDDLEKVSGHQSGQTKILRFIFEKYENQNFETVKLRFA